MNANPWTSVRGVLAKGYRVASGPSQYYPYGALDRQRPLFGIDESRGNPRLCAAAQLRERFFRLDPGVGDVVQAFLQVFLQATAQ